MPDSLYLRHFQPSEEELQLAAKLLETNSWNRSDTLSVDTAIGIFKSNGLSFKQLRDIWTIADKNGTGNLSKEELTVVIRLMGWVQSGRLLDEGLLREKGPLPKIKGITEPTDNSIPWANKTLSDPLSSSASLQITTSQAGTSNILSPPKASAPLLQPTGQVENDINMFMARVAQNQSIQGEVASMFQSPYGLSPSDMAKLWERSSINGTRTVTPGRLKTMGSLLRVKLRSAEATRSRPRKESRETPTLRVVNNPPAIQFMSAAEEKERMRQVFAEREQSRSRLHQSPAPMLPSPQSSDPPDYNDFPEYTDFDSLPVTNFQTPATDLEMPLRWSTPPPVIMESIAKIDDLKDLLDVVVTGQASIKSDLQQSFHHRALLEHELEEELAKQKDENIELQKVLDAMMLTALEQQVLASEHREERDAAAASSNELRATINVQNQQIDTLTELLTQMEGEISKGGKQIDNHDLRLRFLRASLQQALEAKSRAELEITDLRTTVNAQETELAALRSKVAILEEQKQSPEKYQVFALQQHVNQQNEVLEAKIRGLQDTMEQYLPRKSLDSVPVQPSSLKRRVAMKHPSTTHDQILPSQSTREGMLNLASRETMAVSVPTLDPASPTALSAGKYYSYAMGDAQSVSSRSSDSESMSSRSSDSRRTIRRFTQPYDSTSISSLPTLPSPMRMTEDSQFLTQLEGDIFLLKSDIRQKGYIRPDTVQRLLSRYDISPEDLTDFGLMAEVEIDVASNILRRKVKASRRRTDRPLSTVQDGIK